MGISFISRNYCIFLIGLLSLYYEDNRFNAIFLGIDNVLHSAGRERGYFMQRFENGSMSWSPDGIFSRKFSETSFFFLLKNRKVSEHLEKLALFRKNGTFSLCAHQKFFDFWVKTQSFTEFSKENSIGKSRHRPVFKSLYKIPPLTIRWVQNVINPEKNRKQ